MEAKLEVNADHFPTERAQVQYVQNRLGGKATEYLMPRVRSNSLQPVLTAEEAFEYLEQAFGDPNQEQTAREKYRRCYQKDRPFSEFWSEFSTHATNGNIAPAMIQEELKHRVNRALV